MSATNENKNVHDWSDDPQLTAYALGELEGVEATEFEARVAGDEEAQALIAELRSFGLTLEESFSSEAAPELHDEQRRAIEEQLEEQVVLTPSVANHRSWQKPFAIAATVIIAGLGTAMIVSQNFRGEVSTMGIDFTQESSGSSAPMNEAVASSKSYGEAESKAPSESYSETLNSIGYIGPSAGIKAKGSNARGLSQERLRALKDLGYMGADEDLETLGYSGGVEDRRGRPERMLRSTREVVEEEPLLRDQELPREASREAYDRIYENSFLFAKQMPLSTFSVDVDTASYANVRRFLNDGQLPPPDAVRLEELVNYFSYDYATPTGEHPFSVNLEVGSAPWKPQHRLVRIGLQGRATLAEERASSNLVFLLDVSGSMNNPDKLPLLKKALQMLVQELDERDTISIVVYAGSSGVVLPATNCSQSVNTHMALERLEAGGSTNGGAGIELAYKMAAQNFIKGGINRVILATDGDFNVGVSDDGSLVRLIEEKAKTGVFLSVLGFGSGNLQDSKMEKLADKGNGNYAYIDSVFEARKVLVEQMGATLETIAKDVKIQVDFNPSEVQAYRLIGYENRIMAAQDFRDDTKDAGEIGAGHTVTALYEVVPVGVPFEAPEVEASKYQNPGNASSEAFSGELLDVRVAYKQPDGDTSTYLTVPLTDTGLHFEELSPDTRFAAAVAGFGMILRGSQHAGSAKLANVSNWAMASAGDDPGGYRAQFIGLVSKARELRGE